MTTPDYSALVAAVASAKAALAPLQATLAAARAAYKAACSAWGIKNPDLVAGVTFPPSIPSGEQADLTGLATAFFNARAAFVAQQAAVNAAKAALQAAIAANGGA